MKSQTAIIQNYFEEEGRVVGNNDHDDDSRKIRLDASKVQGPPYTVAAAVDQSEYGVITGIHRDQSGTHQLGQHPPQPQFSSQRRRVVSFPYTTNSNSSAHLKYNQQAAVNRGDGPLNILASEQEEQRATAVASSAPESAQRRSHSLSPRGQVVPCSTLYRSPPGLQRPSQLSLDPPPYTKSSSRINSQSPGDFRTRSSPGRMLNRVPEDSEMDPSAYQQNPQSSTRAGENQHLNQPNGTGYGTISRQNSGQISSSYAIATHPVGYDSDDDSSNTDEEEWLLDEELAREGLYRGNYKRLVTLYTFVPISTAVTFAFLALLPFVTLPPSSPSSSPFPYPHYVPYPLPEVLTATALWSLSYLLRDFFYTVPLTFMTFLPSSRRYPNLTSIIVSFVSAILQSTSTLVLRQLAIPILLVPYYSTQQLGMLQKPHFPSWRDDAFKRIWWIALGWAAAEAIVGIKQGYESIALYKDVLVSVKKTAGRSEMAGAVAGLRGTPSRPMEIREHASTSKQVIDGMPQTSPSKTRPKTPTEYLFDTDTDVESASHATPTQRNWGRTRALSDDIISGDGNITPQLPPAPQIQRDNSDSLASSVNSIAGYGYASVYGMEGLTNSGRNLTSGLDRLRAIDPVGVEREPLLLTLNRRRKTESLRGDADSEQERLLAEVEVERDLEELLALKNREELEEVYGIPVIRIPVFISCLFRINSILSSLSMTLILTAVYMRSTFATYRPASPPFSSVTSYIQTLLPTQSEVVVAQADATHKNNAFLFYSFFALLALQSVFGMMHTPWVLPRIGVHTFVYVQLVILLALFFAALGIWEVLA